MPLYAPVRALPLHNAPRHHHRHEQGRLLPEELHVGASDKTNVRSNIDCSTGQISPLTGWGVFIVCNFLRLSGILKFKSPIINRYLYTYVSLIIYYFFIYLPSRLLVYYCLVYHKTIHFLQNFLNNLLQFITCIGHSILLNFTDDILPV